MDFKKRRDLYLPRLCKEEKMTTNKTIEDLKQVRDALDNSLPFTGYQVNVQDIEQALVIIGFLNKAIDHLAATGRFKGV